jgi:hypothetical protein
MSDTPLDDLVGVISGLVLILLPLSIFALPGVIVLGLVIIPLALLAVPVLLVGAVVAVPWLLFRRR